VADTIETIEPGAVFKADGVYAVKSEYHYPDGNSQCVLLASGEYAHFSRGNATPVEISHFSSALDAERAARERAQAALRELDARLASGYTSLTWEQFLEIRAIIARGLGEYST